MRRVADQLCSAHASLRDRFQQRALALDVIILLLSAWITAMAFVDPVMTAYLMPNGWSAQLWIGILSVCTFGLTLVQLRTDWKGRSEGHARSFSMYAEVKREAGYLLASYSDHIPAREFQRLASRYDMASDIGIGILESEFLRQKKRHKIKVHLSKILDDRPGASLLVERAKLMWNGIRNSRR